MIGWGHIQEEDFDARDDFVEKCEAFKKLPKEIAQKHMLNAIINEMEDDLHKVRGGVSNIVWMDAIEAREALRDLYAHLIDLCAYLSVVSER